MDLRLLLRHLTTSYYLQSSINNLLSDMFLLILQTPLKRVHTPVNVGFKKFVAQSESMLKDKRGHVPPSPYYQPVNLQLRPAHNPSTHHLRCPGPNRASVMPVNEVCSGAVPQSNIYSAQPVKHLPLEIHKDISYSNHKNYNNNNNSNNNINKNKNSNNPRHPAKVPLLKLPQEPIWSDYEPSPARLRDEERKRQDKVLFFLCKVLSSSCHGG